MTGSWSEFNFTISSNEHELFNTVMKKHVGVGYTALAVASQIVAGENYCFLCKARPATQNPTEFAAEVYIYQPLNDPKHTQAHVTRLVQLKAQSQPFSILRKAPTCTIVDSQFHYHQGENVNQANSPLRVQLPTPEDGTYSWTWDTSKPQPSDCVSILTEGYCGFFNELLITWKHTGQTTAYFVSGGMGGAPSHDTMELEITAC
jgi:hypothetical protein